MQQDAMQRVREMQRRARERVEASNRMAAALPAAQPPPAPGMTARNTPAQSAMQSAMHNVSPARTRTPAQHPAPQASGAFPFQGILEKLGMDGETGLILILLLLLINEGADRSVILALVYILVA